MTIVAVSGGFDPIHEGHVQMIEEASSYGAVLVILNSDEWLLRKKGFIFMEWNRRAEIIRALRKVYSVTFVDDTDGTVCEALQRLRPDFFANGGDRKQNNTPELELCGKLGIKPIFNIGGGKANSSSDLVKRLQKTTTRPWGEFTILDEGYGYKVKRILVKPRQRLSLQSHSRRAENWTIVQGVAKVIIDDIEQIRYTGQSVSIPLGAKHRLINPCEEPELILIETQNGSYLGEDDIVRYDDDYGRIK